MKGGVMMGNEIEEKVEELKSMGVNVKEKSKEQENSAESKDEGSEPKTNTLVDDTNLAAKRMEDATAAAKEERLAREESYAKMKLSGQTEAGQTPVKKEETPAEYTKEVMAGELNG